MNNQLADVAADISSRLEHINKERIEIGREGFAMLEKLDPELATLAKEVWNNSTIPSNWFTEMVPSLGRKTPWQCLAEGRRQDVLRVLNAIEHGDYV